MKTSPVLYLNLLQGVESGRGWGGVCLAPPSFFRNWDIFIPHTQFASVKALYLVLFMYKHRIYLNQKSITLSFFPLANRSELEVRLIARYNHAYISFDIDDTVG